MLDVPRPPTPIKPIVIRLDGATRPSRPRADAGMMEGNPMAAAQPVAILGNCRRLMSGPKPSRPPGGGSIETSVDATGVPSSEGLAPFGVG